MENKLELNHIAPYLPYGLKLMYGCILDEKNDEIRIMNVDNISHLLEGYGTFVVQPILRPLSDLLNNEVVESLCLKEVKRDWCEFASRPTFTNDIPYRVYLELFKHHFDVFGLIEKGLAIDKNKL